MIRSLGWLSKKSHRNVAYAALSISFIAMYALAIATDEQHEVVGRAYEVEKPDSAPWVKKYEEAGWYAENGHIMFRLKTLDVVLSGKYEDYLDLVAEQANGVRLEWGQFQDYQNHVRVLMEGNPEMIREALEFAIVVGEIGDTETARKKAWVYEIVASDAMSFIEQVMEKHPEILPSYSRLKPEQQQLAKGLLTLVRFHDVSNLCASEEVFERIKKSKILERNPEVFEFALFVHVCTVSPLTKYAFQNILAIRKAFYLLNEKSAKEVTHHYLSERSEWMGFDPGSPLNRMLLRVAAMMKLYTPLEGKMLKEAFLKFQPSDLSAIVSHFDVARPKEKGVRFTGLNTLLLALKDEGRLEISGCVHTTFPFLVKMLREKAAEVRKASQLDFHKIIPLVVQDPDLLKEGKIGIENDGLITVAR